MKDDEKRIVEMTKEEKFRIKGLDAFIAGADKTARGEFKNLCIKVNSPWHQETEHIYAAGYLSCLKGLTLTMNNQ